MIKEIIKDTKVLTQISTRFIIGEDEHLIADLIDTANAHKEVCAGLACIQIGVPKRVIVVKQAGKFVPYINPIIEWKSRETYIAQEGCLSVEGVHEVKRHQTIKLFYQDKNGKTRSTVFSGFLAEVIQHECDHLKGILI